MCASTLASVSGAAAASVFGVAGTIAGTATMSVVATVGGAVYSFWLRRTHARLQEAPITNRVVDLLSNTAGGKVRPQVEGDRTAEHSDMAETAEAASPTETTEPEAATAAAEAEVTAATGPSGEVSGEDPDGQAPGPWAWVARRHWGVVAGVAVVFVISLGLVTLVELIGQRPLADIAGGESSGGTSIGKVVDSDDDAPEDGTTTTTRSPDTTTDPSGTVTTEEDSSDSETTNQDTGTTSSTSTTVGSSSTSTTTGSTTSTTVATPSTTATTSTPP